MENTPDTLSKTSPARNVRSTETFRQEPRTDALSKLTEYNEKLRNDLSNCQRKIISTKLDAEKRCFAAEQECGTLQTKVEELETRLAKQNADVEMWRKCAEDLSVQQAELKKVSEELESSRSQLREELDAARKTIDERKAQEESGRRNVGDSQALTDAEREQFMQMVEILENVERKFTPRRIPKFDLKKLVKKNVTENLSSTAPKGSQKKSASAKNPAVDKVATPSPNSKSPQPQKGSKKKKKKGSASSPKVAQGTPNKVKDNPNRLILLPETKRRRANDRNPLFECLAHVLAEDASGVIRSIGDRQVQLHMDGESAGECVIRDVQQEAGTIVLPINESLTPSCDHQEVVFKHLNRQGQTKHHIIKTPSVANALQLYRLVREIQQKSTQSALPAITSGGRSRSNSSLYEPTCPGMNMIPAPERPARMSNDNQVERGTHNAPVYEATYPEMNMIPFPFVPFPPPDLMFPYFQVPFGPHASESPLSPFASAHFDHPNYHGPDIHGQDMIREIGFSEFPILPPSDPLIIHPSTSDERKFYQQTASLTDFAAFTGYCGNLAPAKIEDPESLKALTGRMRSHSHGDVPVRKSRSSLRMEGVTENDHAVCLENPSYGFREPCVMHIKVNAVDEFVHNSGMHTGSQENDRRTRYVPEVICLKFFSASTSTYHSLTSAGKPALISSLRTYFAHVRTLGRAYARMVFENLIEELRELRKALRSVAVRLRDSVFVIVYEGNPSEQLLGTVEGTGGKGSGITAAVVEDAKSSKPNGRKRDEGVQENRKKHKVDSALETKTVATGRRLTASSDDTTATGNPSVSVSHPSVTKTQANRDDPVSDSDSESDALGVIDVKVVQFSQSRYVPGNGPDREYLSVLAELIALIRILSQENV